MGGRSLWTRSGTRPSWRGSRGPAGRQSCRSGGRTPRERRSFWSRRSTWPRAPAAKCRPPQCAWKAHRPTSWFRSAKNLKDDIIIFGILMHFDLKIIRILIRRTFIWFYMYVGI